VVDRAGVWQDTLAGGADGREGLGLDVVAWHGGNP